MKYYKEIEQPKLKIINSMKCDLCGRSVPGESWGNSHWDEKKVTINYKEKNTYPGGGHIINITVDMCPNCFRSKFLKWLETEGCKINIENWRL